MRFIWPGGNINPTFLFICFMGLMLLSCQKEQEFGQPTLTNKINLGDLKVGQKSRFEFFSFDQEGNVFSERQFHPDTLVVEVVGETTSGFIVEERLSEGSMLWNDAENPFSEVIQHIWISRSDTLRIDPIPGQQDLDSYLFHYRVSPFPLSPYQQEEIDLFDGLPSGPYMPYARESFVRDATLNDFEIEHLNVYLDWHAMAFDGPGVGYYFQPNRYLFQTIIVYAWTGSGKGWRLLD